MGLALFPAGRASGLRLAQGPRLQLAAPGGTHAAARPSPAPGRSERGRARPPAAGAAPARRVAAGRVPLQYDGLELGQSLGQVHAPLLLQPFVFGGGEEQEPRAVRRDRTCWWVQAPVATHSCLQPFQPAPIGNAAVAQSASLHTHTGTHIHSHTSANAHRASGPPHARTCTRRRGPPGSAAAARGRPAGGVWAGVRVCRTAAARSRAGRGL